MLRLIMIDECGDEVIAYNMPKTLENELKNKEEEDCEEFYNFISTYVETEADEYDFKRNPESFFMGKLCDELGDEDEALEEFHTLAADYIEVEYPDLEDFKEWTLQKYRNKYQEARGFYWEDTSSWY